MREGVRNGSWLVVLGMGRTAVCSPPRRSAHNLFGLDLIHQDDGTTTRTLLADGLGSVRTEMVDGAVETVTTYEPYGNLLAQTGTSGTVYGFTGEQHDSTTGLQYLRARYYNPSLHVFLSRDPYPGSPGKPSTQHGYSYGSNNPLRFIYPSGLYGREVHYNLTYLIGLLQLSKCGGGSACAMYAWIAKEIAWADQHMDESWLKLTAVLNNDLHFAELTTVQRNLRRAIAIAEQWHRIIIERIVPRKFL